MILYRADHKGNSTLPEKYCAVGLMTKQINSEEDPRNHGKYNWLTTIKSHINPQNAIEQNLYNTTEYLSCTTSMEVVDKYLKTADSRTFRPCCRDDAEAFVFELNIDDSMMRSVGNGLYAFSYKCNYRRYVNDDNFRTEDVHAMQCNICENNTESRHKILIIDTATFLHDFRFTLHVEYEKAVRDREWLLLPIDTSPRGVILQGRIAIADFWNVQFFKYVRSRPLA